jgi:ribosomal protein S1
MRYWRDDVKAIRRMAALEQASVTRTVHGVVTQVTTRGARVRLDGSQKFVKLQQDDQVDNELESGDHVLISRHTRSGIRSGWSLVAILPKTRVR